MIAPQTETRNSNARILIDQSNKIFHLGSFTGGVITKLKTVQEMLFFSDQILIEADKISLHGLDLGVYMDSGTSKEKDLIITDLTQIDFSVVLDPALVQKFDKARFSAFYPNIVRFLHTACVYLSNPEYPSLEINHLNFVSGEILNRPVAITNTGGVIIGDRLVVDENLNLIFYNTILIGRSATTSVQVTYEHFIMIPISSLYLVLLLGLENF